MPGRNPAEILRQPERRFTFGKTARLWPRSQGRVTGGGQAAVTSSMVAPS